MHCSWLATRGLLVVVMLAGYTTYEPVQHVCIRSTAPATNADRPRRSFGSARVKVHGHH